MNGQFCGVKLRGIQKGSWTILNGYQIIPRLTSAKVSVAAVVVVVLVDKNATFLTLLSIRNVSQVMVVPARPNTMSRRLK